MSNIPSKGLVPKGVTKISNEIARQIFSKDTKPKPIKVNSSEKKPIKKKAPFVPVTTMPTQNMRAEMQKHITAFYTPNNRELAYQLVYFSGPYFIPGQVISSKRGKQISNFWQKDGTTRKGLRMSDAAKAYCEATAFTYDFHAADFWQDVLRFQQETGTQHLEIGLFFLRKDHGIYDYQNMSQLPLDLMQKHRWMPNDDSRTLTPHYLGEKVVGEGNEGIHIYLMRKTKI